MEKLIKYKRHAQNHFEKLNLSQVSVKQSTGFFYEWQLLKHT